MSSTGAVRPAGDHPGDELGANRPGGYLATDATARSDGGGAVDPTVSDDTAPGAATSGATPSGATPSAATPSAAPEDGPREDAVPEDAVPEEAVPEDAELEDVAGDDASVDLGLDLDADLDGGSEDFEDFDGDVHPAGAPALVDLPDEDAAGAVRARLAAPDVPPRTLGDLGELAVWAAGVQGRAPAVPFRRVRALVLAADHGVAGRGVSAFPAADSARRARRLLSGGGRLSLLAGRAGVTLRLVDVGLDTEPLAVASTRRIRRGSGSIDVEDALTAAEALDAYALGRALVDEEVDAGTDLLVPCVLGVGATTPATVVVAALTDTEPAAVVGRGSGIDDETWMRKCVAVRDALRRARPHVHEMTALLGSVGGVDLAVTAGMLLQAAVRRTPVLLDGVVAAAAALIARDTTPDAVPWWQVLDRSDEPAERVALEALGLEPLLALGLRAGGGTGALAALPLLQTAIVLAGELGPAPEPAHPDLDSGPGADPRPVADHGTAATEPVADTEPVTGLVDTVVVPEPEPDVAPVPERDPATGG